MDSEDFLENIAWLPDNFVLLECTEKTVFGFVEFPYLKIDEQVSKFSDFQTNYESVTNTKFIRL